MKQCSNKNKAKQFLTRLKQTMHVTKQAPLIISKNYLQPGVTPSSRVLSKQLA